MKIFNTHLKPPLEKTWDGQENQFDVLAWDPSLTRRGIQGHWVVADLQEVAKDPRRFPRWAYLPFGPLVGPFRVRPKEELLRERELLVPHYRGAVLDQDFDSETTGEILIPKDRRIDRVMLLKVVAADEVQRLLDTHTYVCNERLGRWDRREPLRQLTGIDLTAAPPPPSGSATAPA